MAPPPPPTALDALPVAAALIVADGRPRAANAAFAAVWGPPLPAGTALGELFPREPDPVARLADAGAGPVRMEGTRRNGVPFVADVHARRGPDGLVLVLHEVNGARLVDETTAHLGVAVDRAPIGMGLFDPDGRYVRVNDALCAMLGRTAPDLVGRRDQEFTHPDDRARDVEAAWRGCAASSTSGRPRSASCGRTARSSGRSPTSPSSATPTAGPCAGSASSRTSARASSARSASRTSPSTTSSRASRTAAACTGGWRCCWGARRPRAGGAPSS